MKNRNKITEPFDPENERRLSQEALLDKNFEKNLNAADRENTSKGSDLLSDILEGLLEFILEFIFELF